jgi:hypothetical protein
MRQEGLLLRGHRWALLQLSKVFMYLAGLADQVVAVLCCFAFICVSTFFGFLLFCVARHKLLKIQRRVAADVYVQSLNL